MGFSWLRGIRQSITAPAVSTGGPQPRLSSIGIGYCPDCKRLRATSSPSCTYCGSAASVTADA